MSYLYYSESQFQRFAEYCKTNKKEHLRFFGRLASTGEIIEYSEMSDYDDPLLVGALRFEDGKLLGEGNFIGNKIPDVGDAVDFWLKEQYKEDQIWKND